MNDQTLIATALEHLNKLCNNHPHRQVGSIGNHAAKDYFAQLARKFGFKVEELPFDWLGWESGDHHLIMGAINYDFEIRDYSLCQKAPQTETGKGHENDRGDYQVFWFKL